MNSKDIEKSFNLKNRADDALFYMKLWLGIAGGTMTISLIPAFVFTYGFFVAGCILGLIFCIVAITFAVDYRNFRRGRERFLKQQQRRLRRAPNASQ